MSIEAARTLPLEEVMALTETKITKDAELAFSITQIGLSRAIEAENTHAEGVFARQGAFRAVQAIPSSVQALDTASALFTQSFEAFSVDTDEGRRERVATHLLKGRAWRLLLLRDVEIDEVTKQRLDQESDQSFEDGESILQEQHRLGRSWDRFGTMLARHRSTSEAMKEKPQAVFAADIALRGIWRAVRSKSEAADKPLPARAKAYAKFAAEQTAANVLAFCLAASAPLERVKPLANLRHRFALWMLG